MWRQSKAFSSSIVFIIPVQAPKVQFLSEKKSYLLASFARREKGREKYRECWYVLLCISLTELLICFLFSCFGIQLLFWLCINGYAKAISLLPDNNIEQKPALIRMLEARTRASIVGWPGCACRWRSGRWGGRHLLQPATIIPRFIRWHVFYVSYCTFVSFVFGLLLFGLFR